jgi:hypothetical protein
MFTMYFTYHNCRGVSTTRKKQVPHQDLDIQPDLTYRERPIRILEESEQRTRNNVIKFYKVQWSNHTEEEATWEREDHLKAEYPYLFEGQQKSRGRDFS